MLADLSDSVVVLVDMQSRLMPVICESEQTVKRAAFVLDCAAELEVPVLATTQKAASLGGLVPELGFSGEAFDKMSFSCAGCPPFMDALQALARHHVYLIGVETHICIMQTALELKSEGYEVSVVADAVSARTSFAHKLGMKRLRDSGIELSLSESVVYEWMRTAEHPSFKAIVKKVISLDSGE